MKNLHKSALLALLALGAFALLTPAALQAAPPKKGKPAAKKPASKAKAIAWQKDFNKAFALSRKTRKPMMVDFYTDWCGWCKELDRRVYTDAKVRSLAAKFISVKLNPETDPVAGSLAQKVGVTGFPTIVFISPKGEAVHGVPGFKEAPDFLGDMKQALKLAKK